MISSDIPIYHIGCRTLKVAYPPDLMHLIGETIFSQWDKNFDDAVIFCDTGPGLGYRGEIAIIAGALLEGTITHETPVICVPGAINSSAEDTIGFCLAKGARLLYDARYAGEICRKEIGEGEDPTKVLRKYETSALMKDTSLLIHTVKGEMQLRYCGKVDDEIASLIAKKRLSASTSWISPMCETWRHLAHFLSAAWKSDPPVGENITSNDIAIATFADSGAKKILDNLSWDLLNEAGAWSVDESVLHGCGDFDEIEKIMKRRETLLNQATSNIEDYILSHSEDDLIAQALPYMDKSRQEISNIFDLDQTSIEFLSRIRALAYAVNVPATAAAYDAGVPIDDLF